MTHLCGEETIPHALVKSLTHTLLLSLHVNHINLFNVHFEICKKSFPLLLDSSLASFPQIFNTR